MSDTQNTEWAAEPNPKGLRTPTLIRATRASTTIEGIGEIGNRAHDRIVMTPLTASFPIALFLRDGWEFFTEKPKVHLPTETGCTIRINGMHNGRPAHGPGSQFVRAEGSNFWFNYRGPVAVGEVEALAAEHGFTIVARPVAEVAAEVLADVRREVLRQFPRLEESSNLTKAIDRAAAKWATK